MKRVICLVPSLTETLIEAGIQVVGRTRYCIHPKTQVAQIPVVGGTKDVRWSLVEPLNADLLILDRQENPKRFADQSPIPFFATDVTSVENVGSELARLAVELGSEELRQIAKRWSIVAEQKKNDLNSQSGEFWRSFPGVLEWWIEPKEEIAQVFYMIWREPWMTISPDTFIGSMLIRLGVRLLPSFETHYPKIEIKDFVKPGSLILFSSEPYDFKKEREELMKFNVACALVDGESFSWFGIRSLKFLEEHLL